MKMIGKNNPNFKHGLYYNSYYCIDCGKELSSGKAKRCRSCSASKVMIKKFKNYKKKVNLCIDCKKEISSRAKRCKECMYKFQKYRFVGKNNPMFGKIKELNHFYGKKHSKETKLKMRLIKLGKKRTTEALIKQSISAKKKWLDKTYRNKVISNLWKSLKRSPNGKEKELINILNNNFSNKYKFVGDGKFILDIYCPDFINKKDKKIIELFGNYWHNLPNYIIRDKKRLETYEKYGYKTLIIWEHELKNIDSLLNKIREFDEEKLECQSIGQ